MSKRTRSGSATRTNGQPMMSKAERRAAAKAAKARAAKARKRREALTGALVGLAVVVLLVGAFLVFKNWGGDEAAGPQSAASATPDGGTLLTPPAASEFPPLPEGADPALGRKPDAGRGEGELTDLKVTTLIEGTGPAASNGQTVTVNYVGVYYESGQEFDASWNRGEPFSFELGAGKVIPGWDRGLVGAKVGSRIQLDIPTKLAYGENPRPGSPAGPLRFIVDVLSIK